MEEWNRKVPFCKLCEDTGFLINERDDGISGAAECSCRKEREYVARYARAGVPPYYRLACFDSFRHRDISGLKLALHGVKKFADEFPGGEDASGLLITGAIGTGKTHLAIAAFKVLLAKGHECIFMDYSELLDRIKAGYRGAAAESDREPYKATLETPVLLLDDIGSQRSSEWVQDTMTGIVTYRYNHGLPMIATTNMSDRDIGDSESELGEALRRKWTLSERIGDRALSRLLRMCRIIRMPECGDYRMKAFEARQTRR